MFLLGVLVHIYVYIYSAIRVYIHIYIYIHVIILKKIEHQKSNNTRIAVKLFLTYSTPPKKMEESVSRMVR